MAILFIYSTLDQLGVDQSVERLSLMRQTHSLYTYIDHYFTPYIVPPSL